ncbi:Iron-sulfur binding protein [uncultured delta proteobacterium]|uniref:Iron-sulfur binding protein n=1 Tax=uncultured delta proteobacterium TaxID=34034 RepID=A0A212IY52_9DELT|nr:Iron-sulfur binding protein [uncultured delta proteobacterium]
MGQTTIGESRNALEKTFTVGEALAWAGVLLIIIILGAHYFRAGNTAAVLCLAGLILFHGSGAAWKTYAVGTALVWGVWEWGTAVQSLVMLRAAMGAPWARGAAILGVVAALTALAASHTLAKAARRGRATPAEPALTRAAAFTLTFLALYGLRWGRPDILLLERLFPAWGSIQIFLLSWYAGYIAGKLNNPRTSRKTRKIVWFLFTAVFFGQLALGLAGIPGMTLPGTPHVPVPAFILFAPAYRGSFTMMPFLVLAATLLAGSAWCSMLCYFGSIEAVAGSGKPVKKARPMMETAIRHGRAAILLLGLASALILRYRGAPAMLTLGLVALFTAGSLVVMLFVSRRYTGMVHCTAFCPMGLVVNLLGILSSWRLRIDPARCNGCGSCEKVCAYRALDAPCRERGQAALTCSLCRDCMGACPRNAIYLKHALLPAKAGGSVFTVITVALHVLFLAAARPM